MKQLLLLVLLLGLANSAQAQLGVLSHLISTAVSVGVGAAVDNGRTNRDSKSDATIVPAYYRGQEYPQKRTLANKLKGPGGDQVAYQESLLNQCRTTMLADSTTTLGTTDLWDTIKSSQEVITQYRPTWNTKAYADELAFYKAEDARRQRVAQPAAR